MPNDIPRKPKKPRPDFPLFPHASGRWAKKIRGKFSYFGKVADDPKGVAALEQYLRDKDALQAGLKPRGLREGLTVRDLCNRFLTAKRHLVDTRELTSRTWGDYHSAAVNVRDGIGADRLVMDLDADDFRRLRGSLAQTRGPVALGNEIQRARMIFKFAFDNHLIDRPVRFGGDFRKPTRKTLRIDRAQRRQTAGKRMLEAADLRQVIEAAPAPLKAMILLGANAGLGQTDVAMLPRSAINLETAWLDYPRPKTGVERRVPLWGETVAAIKARPKPKLADDAGLLFLTRFGRPWVRVNADGAVTDKVGTEFNKLLTRLGLKRPGLSFYCLRHGVETVGGEARDQVALDALMGHVDESMGGKYREGIGDDRLKAVTDHVRQWLLNV